MIDNQVSLVCRTIAGIEMRAKIHQALLAGIDEERFVRTALTAIQTSPSLVDADKNSLYNAVIKAAQDGLLPDGKEGALVVFTTDGKKTVTWMPMIAGIRKRLAKSGVLLEAHVVYSADEFEVEFGDEPRIIHKPAKLGTDRGAKIGAYAIARTKDGETMREVMDAEQIGAVREQSRAKNGMMWTKFESEAWRKTVARRLAKSVPMLDDIGEMLKAGDEDYTLYDAAVEPVPTEQTTAPATPPKRGRTLQAVVDQAPPSDEREPGQDDEVF